MENQEINGEVIDDTNTLETDVDNSGSGSPPAEGEGAVDSVGGVENEESGINPDSGGEGEPDSNTDELPSGTGTPEDVGSGSGSSDLGTVEDSGQIEGQESESDVSTSKPEYSVDNPMPVTIIEPVPEEEELEVFSLSGTYSGTISETYLNYFRGVVQKLDSKEHYVVYRSGQYSYTMVYGEEIQLEDGGRFTGTGNFINIYRSSSSYNNDWFVDYGEDTLALSAGDLFVYSDLGMYPTLKEGGSALEFTALLFAVGFAVVYSVCHDIFDYIMEHVYRK